MDSFIKKERSIPRVAPKCAGVSKHVLDAPLVNNYKSLYSFRGSITSTVLTAEYSDSDLSSCDEESESVGHGYCDLIDQEGDEPTFSYADDTWGCLEDESRQSSDATFDDYATGSLTRCLSDARFDDTTHEDFHVRFNDTVEVREFAITVGHQSHSAPMLCPLTLDWIYSEKTIPLKVERELGSIKKYVRKLTEKQRRAWVSFVQGWPHEKLRSIEIDRVAEAMEEVMQRQESFLDGLIEDGNDNSPASDHSDSLRDWDVSQNDDYEYSTESSLLNVSKTFGNSDDELLY